MRHGFQILRSGLCILYSVFCLALLPAIAFAAEPEKRRLAIGQAEVEFHPGDAGLAREAAASVEYACSRIGRELGLSFTRPVKVALVRGRAEFNRACGADMPAWSLAAALPLRGAIIVDAALAAPATANDMHLAIFHETVHLALAETEKDRPDRLPRWFHEGVAVRLSGAQHLRADRTAFDIAAAHGALIPLDKLALDFPADAAEADLAYLESESFIAYLTSTRSPEALRWILDYYRNGRDFESAFSAALGVSRAETERCWAETLRVRFPWLRTILESVTFWGALALATLAVFLIVRWRARRQRQEWEREEREWRVVSDDEDDEDELAEEDVEWEPEDEEDDFA